MVRGSVQKVSATQAINQFLGPVKQVVMLSLGERAAQREDQRRLLKRVQLLKQRLDARPGRPFAGIAQLIGPDLHASAALATRKRKHDARTDDADDKRGGDGDVVRHAGPGREQAGRDRQHPHNQRAKANGRLA